MKTMMRIRERVDCEDYKQGRCRGNCEGMGHYQCEECRWRKPKYKRKQQ